MGRPRKTNRTRPKPDDLCACGAPRCAPRSPYCDPCRVAASRSSKRKHEAAHYVKVRARQRERYRLALAHRREQGRKHKARAMAIHRDAINRRRRELYAANIALGRKRARTWHRRNRDAVLPVMRKRAIARTYGELAPVMEALIELEESVMVASTGRGRRTINKPKEHVNGAK